EGPKLLWTFRDAGAGFSGPAIVGERLYTMGADAQSDLVFCLDLTTQKKLWTADAGPRYDNGWGDGPRCTPTVDGGLVYALGGNGQLVCLKADGGELVWKKHLVEDLGGSVQNWGFTESPLIDGNQVVVTPGGKKGAVAAL